MQTKQQRMRDIVKQDNARRAARQAEEDALFAPTYSPCPDGVDPYIWDRHITGQPSPNNRLYKASDNCWKRGMRGRTFGIAQAGAAPNTMLVLHNGVTRVVPISEVRSKRDSKAVIRVSRTTTPEVARLAPIQDYTND